MEKMFKNDISFRKLCLLNDWWKLLPSKGHQKMESETSCKRVMQRVTNYDTRYSVNNLTSIKLMAGGLFSCLKIHHHLLFAGMLDGLIKMWDVTSLAQGASDLRRPLKLFEGHEESVTCLDAGAGVLVSGSLDRSVRVWSLESSSLLRVLRREGSGEVPFTVSRCCQTDSCGGHGQAPSISPVGEATQKWRRHLNSILTRIPTLV